jgi:DNA polymerase III, delta subunit
MDLHFKFLCMIQSHLYLSQTYLQIENIQKIITQKFFTQNNFEIQKKDQMCSDKDWQSYQNTGQVILWSGQKTETDSQKEQFKKFIQGEVYLHYQKPTLLFLGDLTSYSDTLQEGMLKILEEPPQNLFIILFAQSLSLLKSTIISRCQIHTLEVDIILSNLDLSLLEKTKKLPTPTSAVQNLLSDKKVIIEKVSDFERDEIDFWLWQVQTNLSFLYKKEMNHKTAEAISKVLQARKLNNDNLQKKFSLGWLNT